METVRIFVYGTLMSGGRNHEKFIEGAEFLGKAKTRDPFFRMREFASRSAPGMTSPGVYDAHEQQPGCGHISGEIYEISTEALKAMDELESHRFDRSKVTLSDGSQADIYIVREGHKEEPAKQAICVKYDPDSLSYIWKEEAADALPVRGTGVPVISLANSATSGSSALLRAQGTISDRSPDLP
jgi:gamma-glutamylcyclotransferase (GGCT)/AIG2-like uncharacterized protein YtfP